MYNHKAASPIYLCERILRGLLAAGGAALFLGFSAISSGAAPMPSEREQMRHAPTIVSPLKHGRECRTRMKC